MNPYNRVVTWIKALATKNAEQATQPIFTLLTGIRLIGLSGIGEARIILEICHWRIGDCNAGKNVALVS